MYLFISMCTTNLVFSHNYIVSVVESTVHVNTENLCRKKIKLEFVSKNCAFPPKKHAFFYIRGHYSFTMWLQDGSLFSP